MTRNRLLTTLAVAVSLLILPGCYGPSAGYVGVYGQPYYGPGAWGGYPYPGRYPPMGGGVWIGAPICCEDQDSEQGQGEDDADSDASSSASGELVARSSDSDESKSKPVPLGENRQAR